VKVETPSYECREIRNNNQDNANIYNILVYGLIAFKEILKDWET